MQLARTSGEAGQSLQNTERGQLLERVYEALLKAIEQGRFQPGQRLVETEICKWLRVSRTPLRQALTRLQARGLVEHRPGGGLTVSSHDRRAIAELYSFRETLEGTAARLAAQQADEAEVGLLIALVRAQRELRADPRLHARENKVFHNHLYHAAHNRFLLQSVQMLHESLALLGSTTLAVPGRIQTAVREHEEIVAAIAARDPERAERLAREHIRSSYAARTCLLNEEIDTESRRPLVPASLVPSPGDTPAKIGP
jgi:DNA-binding GntR family transcriptional regulator